MRPFTTHATTQSCCPQDGDEVEAVNGCTFLDHAAMCDEFLASGPALTLMVRRPTLPSSSAAVSTGPVAIPPPPPMTYVVDVEGVGLLLGVPSAALRDRESKDPLTSIVTVGLKVTLVAEEHKN